VERERSALRIPFVADAEVAPESTPGATIPARVKEISLQGCYLETPAPYNLETQVLVKIFTPGKYFEAKATVISVRPAAGMGITFRETKPNFRAVLQHWLLSGMRKNGEDGA
jgi:PilZ domain